MPPTTPAAAVVVPAPVILPGVQLARPAVARSPFRGDGRRGGVGRALWVLGAFGEVLIVAFAFPLVILAVGIPVALLVRLAVATGRALWHL